MSGNPQTGRRTDETPSQTASAQKPGTPAAKQGSNRSKSAPPTKRAEPRSNGSRRPLKIETAARPGGHDSEGLTIKARLIAGIERINPGEDVTVQGPRVRRYLMVIACFEWLGPYIVPTVTIFAGLASSIVLGHHGLHGLESGKGLVLGFVATGGLLLWTGLASAKKIRSSRRKAIAGSSADRPTVDV